MEKAKRPKLLGWWLLIAACIVLIILLIPHGANAQSARYQMIRIDNAGYFWTWHTEKPYSVIRQLCWDDAANNWCEPNLNFSRMTYIYEVIDWQEGSRTTIYQLRRGGCIAWQWHNDYGTDNNPHIAFGDLINCP